MSEGGSIPYRLRPNKAVDRELFLSLLSRLAATLRLESYKYVGLGGPFLEDFRLIHGRIGIDDLVCVESDKDVHNRQKFNRPVNSVDYVHDTLENYFESTEFDGPLVIWFDYTKPGQISDQIEGFSRAIFEVPVGSILRITVNANPASLGKPGIGEVAAKAGSMASGTKNKIDIQEWRLDRFRERLGNLFPDDLQPEGMTFKNYGRSLLHALYLAVEKERISYPGRDIVWALATHYADGQPMATATVVMCHEGDQSIQRLVEEWEYYSTPSEPLLLDMPALSTLERLVMESSNGDRERFDFPLPPSDMGVDPFDSFKKFYKVFPHFSRVEL